MPPSSAAYDAGIGCQWPPSSIKTTLHELGRNGPVTGDRYKVSPHDSRGSGFNSMRVADDALDRQRRLLEIIISTAHKLHGFLGGISSPIIYTSLLDFTRPQHYRISIRSLIRELTLLYSSLTFHSDGSADDSRSVLNDHLYMYA